MRLQSRTARISGLLVHWSKFVDTNRHERARFTETAFSGWLRGDETQHFIPIDVHHDSKFPLCRDGLSVVRWTPKGLHASFRLDISNPQTRLAVLAMERGFIRHLSATVAHEKSIRLRDEFGSVRLITSAGVVGISITSRPVIPGTALSVNGHVFAGDPVWPSDRHQRAELEQFLAESGIGFTPKPTPPAPELTVLELHRQKTMAAFLQDFDRDSQTCNQYWRNLTH